MMLRMAEVGELSNDEFWPEADILEQLLIRLTEEKLQLDRRIRAHNENA